jgi:hypothetical protein
MPVQPPPIGGQEDRPVAALADRQVDRSCCARRQRDGDDLAALAGDNQGPVPTLEAQGADLGAGCLGHPQPVEASREIRAWSPGGPDPAATSIAPSSLRSSPVACDS